MRDADLRGADLTGANLTEANLSRANLRAAWLREALLYKTTLHAADLSDADLTNADLSSSNLVAAFLNRANLTNAKLNKADLGGAFCKETKFRNANLSEARLISTNLNGALLTGVCLWETQRTEWKIKGIVCEFVYFDKDRLEKSSYEVGEFERLHAERPRIKIRYPAGIESIEIITLPALIQYLETRRPQVKLRFESIQHIGGGAMLSLVLEEVEGASDEQIQVIRELIQNDASQISVHLRDALREKDDTIMRLNGQVDALKWTFGQLVLERSTNIFLNGASLAMGDSYNINGQAGAVGRHAISRNVTLNQFVNRVEDSVDFERLNTELGELRDAMTLQASEAWHHAAIAKVTEAQEAAKNKDASKVVASLRAAGNWTLDVATKIGVSIATEIIRQSVGLK
jgi:hypothetical protein